MKENGVAVKGVGTINRNQYTREEVVNKLCEYKDALAADFRSRFHETMSGHRWILEDMDMIADKNSFGNTPEYMQLHEDLNKICHIVTTYNKGLRGERDAMRSMSRLIPGEEMEVMHNITIDDGGDRTEIDSIVITPYGIFIIEVKSYGQNMTWDEKGVIGPTYSNKWKKDLGERMNCKEYLIRKELSKYVSVPFYNILLIADNRVEITDNYKRVPISYKNTILADIRRYNTGQRFLTSEEIQDIKRLLMRCKTKVYVDCPIDCESVTTEYNWFIDRYNAELNKGIIKRIHNIMSWVIGTKSRAEAV